VVNASLVLCIVGVSVLVESIQTRRSERAAEALKAQVAQTTTALRDGHFTEILRRLHRSLLERRVPSDRILVLERGGINSSDTDAMLPRRTARRNESTETTRYFPKKSARAVMGTIF
jgi:hypothetical protein